MTTGGTACVVQARMGSTRLPGKVLADVGGTPALAFLLERLRPAAVDHVVVATSVHERDDAVADVAARAGAEVVRGPEEDVLGRYGVVLSRLHCDTVVRLTGDCPLLDPGIIEDALRLHASSGADYTSNAVVRTFPDGLDVEVVRAEALRAAIAEASAPDEREHVTPFVYRRPERFSCVPLLAGEALGHERWTVDTASDLELVRRVVDHFAPDRSFGWADVLAFLGRTPAPVGRVWLRPALPDDSAAVLAWRNDPASVAASLSQRPVPVGEHERWYASALGSMRTRIWIGELDGEPVGQVRVDVESGVGVVSITVAPSHRGRGLSAPLLDELVAAVGPQVLSLVAFVVPGNDRSRRAFERAGFEVVARHGDRDELHRSVA